MGRHRPQETSPEDWIRESVIRLPDGCWRSSLGCNGAGRPSLRVNGRVRLAAVVLWEEEHGPKPEARELAHNCLNRRCVNPGHLRLTTHRDNCMDEFRAGADIRAKLRPSDVRQIRFDAALGAGTQALARRYGVHRTTIRKVVKRQRWGWVK